MVNTSRNNEAKQILQNYAATLNQIRTTAQFFSVDTIRNLDLPDQSLWKAQVWHQGNCIEYVLYNEPFIVVSGKDYGQTSVVWDKIETLRVIKINHSI